MYRGRLRGRRRGRLRGRRRGRLRGGRRGRLRGRHKLRGRHVLPVGMCSLHAWRPVCGHVRPELDANPNANQITSFMKEAAVCSLGCGMVVARNKRLSSFSSSSDSLTEVSILPERRSVFMSSSCCR